MYNLEWANEICKDVHRANIPFKESVREVMKIIAIYVGCMVVMGTASWLLNFAKSRCETTKEIQSAKQDNQNVYDAKNYVNEQIHVKQR